MVFVFSFSINYYTKSGKLEVYKSFMKQCSKCKQQKELEGFYKDGSGLQSLCKECSKARVKLWTHENDSFINENGLKLGTST